MLEFYHHQKNQDHDHDHAVKIEEQDLMMKNSSIYKAANTDIHEKNHPIKIEEQDVMMKTINLQSSKHKLTTRSKYTIGNQNTVNRTTWSNLSSGMR